MIQQFRAVDQSTIWDVCANTYGSYDQIVKLMQDNGFLNVNTYPNNGDIFLFDDTLVANQTLKQTNAGAVKYATRERTTTNEENMKYYEQTWEDQYTASADGETVIVRPALVGMRIISIEKTIAPLLASQYLFNPSSGQITLQGGAAMNAGETLFIEYAKIITS
jgi:hypothetical protein